MGQAFDREGRVIGEQYGATKKEVFDALNTAHPDAERIQVQKVRESEQVPSIGRIVLYTLTADDAAQINRRRTTGASIANRLLWGFAGLHSEALPASSMDGEVRSWPAGAQAHIGNAVAEGDVFPMLITRVWGPSPGSAVNGQAFLDGTDVLWVTSVMVGEGPRTFKWPTRT